MNAAVPLVQRLEGHRAAVVVGGATTTAIGLRRRTLALAHWLGGPGVRANDRVLVLVPPGPDLAAAILAIAWVGAVPVLLEPQQAPGAWQVRVAAADPTFVLADPRLRWAWRVPGLRRLLPGLPGRPDRGRILSLPGRLRDRDPAPAPRAPSDPALVMFTSGTTAAPREVQHSHASLAAFLGGVGALVEGLDVRSYLAETPQQIFYALLLDATCHVVRGTGERRLKRTLDLMASGRVGAWFGGPWTWVRWLDAGLPVPRELRTVLLGSAPVTRPFLGRLLRALPASADVRCVYGLTECGPVCVADGREKVDRDGAGDWVGRPLPGVALSLVDEEVHVRSPGTAPSRRGPDGAVATGDLGRLDDGLWLLGRAKDMILRRNVNLYPGVLEPLFDQDVALIGVYDHAAEDERVVLVTAGPAPADAAARLGDAAPDHVLELDALPRAGRQHKVDKAALRELARERFRIP